LAIGALLNSETVPKHKLSHDRWPVEYKEEVWWTPRRLPGKCEVNVKIVLRETGGNNRVGS
jgi:hypothetical protein